ncbi:MAG TPA: alanine racemase [Plantibacter sp.]|uniref:alanine racemase n=1 Tax=unclassified Plantibacter TaxID=2624265 RepID=UPI002C5A831A|nr:alanine racemase [Plantibacter sp.]
MTAAPAWIEIDAAAIAHNLGLVRQQLAPSTELCAVVKADAYGHGIDLVLPAIRDDLLTCIAITSNAEAHAARAQGYTGRIMRLRPALADEIEDGVSAAIEEWVGGLGHARLVDRIARERRRAILVHVSINSTGLSRDGIDWGGGEAVAELRGIAGLDGLRTVGVCSHFPCDDPLDVERGIAAFAQQSRIAVDVLGGVGPIQRHCATTHVALSDTRSHFDLVRIGAALYGDTDLLDGTLRPAMRLLSRVAAINRYPAGNTAGYDRRHRMTSASTLAVVPVGYADGYHRVLGGQAEVLICGRRAPVVDLLAMNTCLVDVTHLPEVRLGDEVVLYGDQGDERISSQEIERVSGQIAADLYTAWGRLVPRTVRDDGGRGRERVAAPVLASTVG